MQSRQFLGTIYAPILKFGLSLMEDVLKPLTKSAFLPLGFTAVTSATDTDIQKKIYGSRSTTVITSNKEIVVKLK